MKKIIALLVVIIATMTVNAQVANYRTTKFYTRENTVNWCYDVVKL